MKREPWSIFAKAAHPSAYLAATCCLLSTASWVFAETAMAASIEYRDFNSESLAANSSNCQSIAPVSEMQISEDLKIAQVPHANCKIVTVPCANPALNQGGVACWESKAECSNLTAAITPGAQLDQPNNQQTDYLAKDVPIFIEPVVPKASEQPPTYLPGFNAGSPSGFGANWGDAFLGVSGESQGIRSSKADGSAYVGFGLGNSQEYVGLEVVANIISLTPSRFASNGSIDFKLHRSLPDLTSVAIGWQNPVSWGSDAGGFRSSVYGTISKLFVLQPDNPDNPMVLGVTAGLGGGRFRPLDSQGNEVGSVSFFGSVGLQVLNNLSLITDWTGRGLNLGVSYVPFPTVPLFLTGVAVDVVGNDYLGPRYTLNVGYGFKF